MSDRFLIRHPETGEEYGLTSVDVFNERYKPLGFLVPSAQPIWCKVPDGVDAWEAPDLSRKAKRAKAPEAETPKDDD